MVRARSAGQPVLRLRPVAGCDGAAWPVRNGPARGGGGIALATPARRIQPSDSRPVSARDAPAANRRTMGQEGIRCQGTCARAPGGTGVLPRSSRSNGGASDGAAIAALLWRGDASGWRSAGTIRHRRSAARARRRPGDGGRRGTRRGGWSHREESASPLLGQPERCDRGRALRPGRHPEGPVVAGAAQFHDLTRSCSPGTCPTSRS